jgi:hypothetical protein
VDERHAVAVEALHDEAFAAEEADREAALELDAEGHAAGGAEEGVLLADEGAAEGPQVHRQDLARIGCGEGDPPFHGRVVRVDGGEERFARDEPLAGAEQLAEEAALVGGGVAEDRVHLDPGSMNIMLPASPIAASPGSSSTSTNCISSPRIS